jgi:hypothetical protein
MMTCRIGGLVSLARAAILFFYLAIVFSARHLKADCRSNSIFSFLCGRCQEAGALIDDLDRSSDFNASVDLRSDIGRHADAAMRSRISRQHTDVHTNPLPSQSHKIQHWSSNEVAAARRRIDPGANAPPNHPASGIHVVAEDIGAMVFVLLHNRKITGGREAGFFSRGNRRVNRHLIAGVDVGSLLGKGNDDRRVIGIQLRQNTLIDDRRDLPGNQLLRECHLGSPVFRS